MDSVQIANTSKSFMKAFERSNQQFQNPDGTVEWLAVPAVVCLAFSIEVAMKALIARRDGTNGRQCGHNLKDLFEKLANNEQRELIEAVGLSNEEFHVELDKVKDAFKDWRYIYETKTQQEINLAFLNSLGESAQKLL